MAEASLCRHSPHPMPSARTPYTHQIPTNPIFVLANRISIDEPNAIFSPAEVVELNLTFPVARYGVGLSFREVFGIEFCDTPQLAAGSFIAVRKVGMLILRHYSFVAVLNPYIETVGVISADN